ncbi:MAG: hypothetical protein P8X96_16315 [Desulfobacteraceae bacterium]|jgi:hypothetical protein
MVFVVLTSRIGYDFLDKQQTVRSFDLLRHRQPLLFPAHRSKCSRSLQNGGVSPAAASELLQSHIEKIDPARAVTALP